MTDRILAQIERFAPGVRDLVLARSVLGPAGLEEYNANYIGGDINGGAQDLGQLFTRPVARANGVIMGVHRGVVGTIKHRYGNGADTRVGYAVRGLHFIRSHQTRRQQR